MRIVALTQKIEGWAASAGIFYRFAEKYYADMVRREAILAGIGANDRVLCIGGGCCPFSAILFHRLTGAEVTVVDNCATCLPKAREVIRRLDLAENIRVQHADGIDFSRYTVIHIAAQVFPMESVVREVERRMAPGAKLLIRRPKKPLCSLYSKFAALSCCPYVTHPSRGVGSTLLYIAC